KGIPEGPQFSISAATEYDTSASNNSNFLTYQGGGVTLTGFGADRHELDPITDETLPQLPRFRSNPTKEETAASKAYDNYTRSFDPVMGGELETSGMNAGISLQGGDKFTLAG